MWGVSVMSMSHIREGATIIYRRIQVISNLPEFAIKEAECVVW